MACGWIAGKVQWLVGIRSFLEEPSQVTKCCNQALFHLEFDWVWCTCRPSASEREMECECVCARERERWTRVQSQSFLSLGVSRYKVVIKKMEGRRARETTRERESVCVY